MESIVLRFNVCSFKVIALIAFACAMLVGCGGGGSDGGASPSPPAPPTPPPSPPPAPPSPPPSPPPSDAARAAAAAATASNNAACVAIAPFYWEIGDKAQPLASGSVGGGYTADTQMAIASASKFLYAAYVLQQRNGQPTADDVQYLTFRSGYTSFTGCSRNDTVDSCANAGTNGVLTPAHVGKFSYGGGHMQQHADRFMGLGPDGNAELAQAMNVTLMLDAPSGRFIYTQPQLAGGIATTPAIYARFLRGLLDGSLALGAHLSDDAVCANPRLCPGQAINSPAPPNEDTRYGLGHWIEDPVVSDGAFSSAGALGFYPWIDSTRTYYGLVARSATTDPEDPTEPQGVNSMYCGRVIRKAWVSGVEQ